MFAAVDQPTVFTSHCAAHSLPSVLTACASVFHEITWLNLQARGCVIACKCVFVRVCVELHPLPNGRGTVLKREK